MLSCLTTTSVTPFTRPRLSPRDSRIAAANTKTGGSKPVARQRTAGSAARASSQHASTIAMRMR
jgi:hypothetical protein